MRTTWTDWKPADMRDAAESEARTGFDALGAPVLNAVETLPYRSAYTEYGDHVIGCRECQASDAVDCPGGAALLDVAYVGLSEQQRLAASN